MRARRIEHRRGRSAEAGISLLEVLVAMVLVAMIGVIAVNGLRLGKTVWDRSAEAASAGMETRVAQKFLRALIRRARPVRLRDGTRHPPALFDGGPDRLRFVAPLPAHLAPPGDQLVELSLAPRGGGAEMLLRWSPIGAAPPEITPTAPQEVLIARADGLRFRYFGPGPEGGAAAWVDVWRGRTQLPSLVAIGTMRAADAARADGAASAWPTFVARLRVEDPA